MQTSRAFYSIGAMARAMLLVGYTTLSGCLVGPIPTALPDPEPFTPQTLAPVHVGRTTRDEVRNLFAAWTYTSDDGVQTAHIEPQASEDGRYWVFGLPRQVGDWAIVGPFGYRPRYQSWLAKQDNFENHWVLVEFSDDSTVTAFWIAHDETPCRSSGICYHHGYLQIIANEAVNATARSSTAISDRCVLYTYAEDDFDMPVTVTDGVHVAQVFAKTSFVRSEMPVGQQTVSASISTIPAWVVSVPVTCAGNDAHYVALRQHDGLIEAKEEASTGKRAIAKRFLVDGLVVAQPRGARNSLDKLHGN